MFLDSFAKAPEEIVLDFDATDDPVHGDQEGKFFHGYYRSYLAGAISFLRKCRGRKANRVF